ncbi:hypothetical protein T440DRAFT_549974 [Plenodomus tracheiphilus IPT5]|uniref:Uncharacterized protein n=1 Tax=Plenodomus tracheiphilus IPT5 TaxID=1408161 RepID=A0A6A7BPP4_9PLEO|nr:hypothetical protein T440DRAFT_549974 [Plenodomus tracheiphilus IPT5]
MYCLEALPALMALVTMVITGWFGALPGNPGLSSFVPTIEAPLPSITVTKLTRYVEQISGPLPTVTVTTTIGYITPASVVHATTTTARYAMVKPRPKQLQPIWSPRPDPFHAFATSTLTRVQSFGVWLTERKFSIFDLLAFFSVLATYGSSGFLLLYLFARRTLRWPFLKRYISWDYLGFSIPVMVRAPRRWYEGEMARQRFEPKPLPPFPVGIFTVCVRAWKQVHQKIVYAQTNPLSALLSLGDSALPFICPIWEFSLLYISQSFQRVPRRARDVVNLLFAVDEMTWQIMLTKARWAYDMINHVASWARFAIKAFFSRHNLGLEKKEIMNSGEFKMAEDDFKFAFTCRYIDIILLRRENRARKFDIDALVAEFEQYKLDNPTISSGNCRDLMKLSPRQPTHRRDPFTRYGRKLQKDAAKNSSMLQYSYLNKTRNTAPSYEMPVTATANVERLWRLQGSKTPGEGPLKLKPILNMTFNGHVKVARDPEACRSSQRGSPMNTSPIQWNN